MRNDTNNSSGGIGFTGLLTIVFIALKLMGVISWSWWWVLSPMWISAIIGIVILIVYVLWITRDYNTPTIKKRGTGKWKF